MKIDTAKLRRYVIEATVKDWPRIFSTEHRLTPTGAGFGSSRFSSASRSFKVLYAGKSFSTAFAEVVVRDCFEGKTRRFLYRPHLEEFCVTAISSRRDLVLLDLRGAAAYEAGINTDASRARNHTSGQSLSEAVHAQMKDVEGIVFDSRLTSGQCVAIYDRAFHCLQGTPAVDLIRVADLSAEITRMGITVRRKRGYKTP